MQTHRSASRRSVSPQRPRVTGVWRATIAPGCSPRDDRRRARSPGVTVSPQKADDAARVGDDDHRRRSSRTGARRVSARWRPAPSRPRRARRSTSPTGVVTLDAKQPGGTMKAKARTAVDGQRGVPGDREAEGHRVDRRRRRRATTRRTFTHTFSSSGAGDGRPRPGATSTRSSTRLTAKTPFGDDFTLKANAAGSDGLAPGQLGHDGRGRQASRSARRHRRLAVRQERLEPRARQDAAAGLRR